MSSEVFDTYHKEYTTLRDSIKEKLGGIASASPGKEIGGEGTDSGNLVHRWEISFVAGTISNPFFNIQKI